MGVWYLFRCNPSIQFIFINAKASSTVVLKEVIGKTTFFFLIFAQKCINQVLILQINAMYDPLELWTGNERHFWLI